jgi:putative serine protease PepD
MPGECEGMDDPRTAHPENDTQVLDRSQTDNGPSGPSGWIPATGDGVASAPGVTASTGAGDEPTSASTPQPAAPGLPAAQAGTQTEELPALGFAFEPPPPGDEPTAGGSPERRPRKVSAAVVAAILAAGLIGGGAGAVTANALNNDNSSSTVSSLNGTAVSGNDSKSSAADGSVSQVAAAVLPSVVSIEVSGQGGSGEGSGVIISTDGQILTNNHVVALAANGGQLRVTFNDGKTASAEILGRDPSSDLAVIKASGVNNLKPAKLGSSADLQVGQQVVAIGSPLGLQGTVTSGIVSALDRPVRTGSSDSPGGQADTAVFNAIQTDAAINPGNSGGPLVNMSGEVIGINSAIASLSQDGSGQSGSIGVGFAIPIDKARAVATQLAKGQQPSRAFLGVTVQDATGSTPGAQLATVQSGSPAAAAGLKEGDVITKVGDTSIDSADALVAAVRGEAAGAKVNVSYVRDGVTHAAEVTLGSQSSSN